MRDAGHRTPDIGQRTSDIGHRTAKKAKIIYPPPRGVDIKNSPGLLHTPAKFEKNSPNGHRVMRKRKHRAHGAGGARYPPIYKHASHNNYTDLLIFETILAALFWMHRNLPRLNFGETPEMGVTVIQLNTNKSTGNKYRSIMNKKTA